MRPVVSIPVIRFVPLCLVPAPPAEKVERKLVTDAMLGEVRRALQTWAYGGLS